VVSTTPVTVTVSGRVTDEPNGVDPIACVYNVVDEFSYPLSRPVILQPNGDFSFTLSFPATKNRATGNTSVPFTSPPVIWRASENRKRIRSRSIDAEDAVSQTLL